MIQPYSVCNVVFMFIIKRGVVDVVLVVLKLLHGIAKPICLAQIMLKKTSNTD